jgi:hypothetical protein
MAMRGPLRRELGKYRRGQHNMTLGFVGGRHYVTGAVPSPVHGGYPADLYMWGVPRSYHPNLNAPAAQSDEYVTDPDWESHHVPPPHQDRVLRPFPQSEPTEPEFDYDEAKVHSELFLRAMEAQYQPLAEGEEAPTLADIWREHFSPEAGLEPEMGDHIGGPAGMDVSPEQAQRNLPQFWEIADALGQLQKVLPEDHPDIVNLRAAAHVILQHPELLPQPEDFGVERIESRLGSGDPYGVDLFGEPVQDVGQMEYGTDGLFEQQEAAFEQQMQTLDDLLEGAEPNIMPAMEMAGGLDAVVESGDGYPESGGLEQVIEEESFGTAPVEFGQEQAEMMESLVPDPLAANPYGLTPEDEIN